MKSWGSQDGSVVKTPLAMQETWVRSLGQEDTLEKDMATHSSVLAWRIPWTEEPGGLQSMGSQRVEYDRTKHAPDVSQTYRRTDVSIRSQGTS